MHQRKFIACLQIAGCLITSALIAHAGPPPGELIEVKGHKLHILVEGNGSPTVILHPGTAEFSFDWDLVQHKIAEVTRVCSYDRAGYAWSEMSPDFERFGPAAENLHELLSKAGIKPPYILVGHAMGTLYIRDYQRRYPDQVAGMVLVDPTPEDDHRAQMFGNTVSLIDMADHDLVTWKVMPYAPSRTTPPPVLEPVPRQMPAPFDRLPMKWQQERREAMDRFVSEVKGLSENDGIAIMESQRSTFSDLYDARHVPVPLGNLPVMVISRGRDTTPEILEMQEQFAHLSRKTRYFVAEKCGTQIHLQDPDVVVQAVLSLVKKSESTNSPAK